MHRNQTFIKQGKYFEVVELKDRVIIKEQDLSEITDNYAKPPIPRGYKHVHGKWFAGYTIESLTTGSQYVWITAGWLSQGLKRRKFDTEEKICCYEAMPRRIRQGVQKYGGFYMTRFYMSKGEKNGEPKSVKGATPWINVNFDEAVELATKLEEDFRSHLLFGAEYDTLLEWFLKTGVKTHEQIVFNFNEHDIYWHIHHVYGGICEWTQEQKNPNSKYRVIRGNNDRGIARRCFQRKHDRDLGTSFRAALELV